MRSGTRCSRHSSPSASTAATPRASSRPAARVSRCASCCGCAARSWRGSRGRRSSTRRRGSTCASASRSCASSRRPSRRHRSRRPVRCGSSAWSRRPRTCPSWTPPRSGAGSTTHWASCGSKASSTWCGSRPATGTRCRSSSSTGRGTCCTSWATEGCGRTRGVLALEDEQTGKADMVGAVRVRAAPQRLPARAAPGGAQLLLLGGVSRRRRALEHGVLAGPQRDQPPRWRCSSR